MNKLMTSCCAALVAAIAAASAGFAVAQSGSGGDSHRVVVPVPGHVGGCDSTFAKCAPPGVTTPFNQPTGGSGAPVSQVAVVTENDSQTATYNIPGDAMSIVVTMYNDAPPIWQGEAGGFGNAWFGAYTHQMTVQDPSGNPLQTVTIDNTTGWFGAHNGAQGCDNGYSDCQRHITSYIVQQTDIRGDSSSSISPDGGVNEASYVWPMSNPNQKVSVTLYNVPAFYKLNMGTSFNACGTSQPMPAPNNGSWTSYAAPSCSGKWPAQGGANTGSAFGDTRYIAPFQVTNRSNWHIDYQVLSNITQSGLPGGSCSAFTYSSPVSGCSWNVPAEGNGVTYANGYDTSDNGRTHTSCGISVMCGGDFTKQSASWASVQDSSQAGVSDGSKDPPCGSRLCP